MMIMILTTTVFQAILQKGRIIIETGEI